MSNKDNPDEVPEETPSSGENICQRCQGTGDVDGMECVLCEGTGKVNTAVGGGG